VLAEALAVTLVGVGGLLLSARFNLYERFLVWTRGLERYNVDEAPFALFLLVLTLAVFAYRRWREYLAEAAKRQQLESTAAKAHERLIDAVESMPAGVMLFDAGDRLVLANSKTAEFFPELAPHLRPGATFADLARVSLAGGCVADAESREEEWLDERLARHRDADCMFEERRSDGRWFQVHERKTADGGTVGICTEITELKRHEAGLREARKMEAVGRLTGGIAHDFNNLLTIILGNLQMLEDIAEPGAGPGADLVQEALAATKRGGELTERLLAFGRRRPLRPSAVDVGDLVSGMAGLLARALGDPIVVETRIAPDLWAANVDPGQLENAILNLALNARDAMPSGGTLAIDCANARVSGGDAAELAPGDYVRIDVRDTGAGMAPDVAERAFEPFFTTKPEGKGTGLGLSMVYGFARQSGGLAAIESKPGVGTTVRLHLPRSAAARRPAALPAADSRSGRGVGAIGATILVVEDDEGVRRFAARALRERGLRVLEAEDGPAALDILDAGDAVDLLFTDVLMPGGMTGTELAEQALRRRPSLRVLFASGNPEHRVSPAAALPEAALFLRKPYDAGTLARSIAEIMGVSEPPAAPSRPRSLA
jgi:signal transduction histidine kinase/CheY-like chemotaxis protein